jgi:endonuclease/exonuclease/phosphatase family metal-dependent hydrolase
MKYLVALSTAGALVVSGVAAGTEYEHRRNTPASVSSARVAVDDTANPVLTFSTYNVCKISCGTGKYSWKNRRKAVVRTIVSAHADVIAVQEADKKVAFPYLRKELNRYGYSPASNDVCGEGCIQDSYLFYRRDVVQPIDPDGTGAAGTLPQGDLAPGWPRGVDMRNFSWAFLNHPHSGDTFIVAGVHLPNEKTQAGEQMRVAVADALTGWLADKRTGAGVPDAPSLIMGDFNSFTRRQPKGAQSVVANNGYKDSYLGHKRIHGDVPTVNVTGVSRNPFPAKPFRFKDPARVDYIFHDKGVTLLQEVAIHLHGGRFDDKYRSSDHNLVRARIELPVAVSATG